MSLIKYVSKFFQPTKEKSATSNQVQNNIDVSQYLWPEEAKSIMENEGFKKAWDFCKKWQDKAWVNGGIILNADTMKQMEGTEQAIGLSAAGFLGSLYRIKIIADNKDLHIISTQQFQENYYDTAGGMCNMKEEFVKALKPYTKENLYEALKDNIEWKVEVGVIKKDGEGFISEGYPDKAQYFRRDHILESYKDLIEDINKYIKKNSTNASSSVILDNMREVKMLAEKSQIR